MDYYNKYLKYKAKYITSQLGGGEVKFEDIFKTNDEITIKANTSALQHGLELLKLINTRNPDLQIATAESLTAGLIFSTLVDIPWGGFMKYGCFGVYDTNAKRVFLDVTIDNVYSIDCAKEMALGVLNNSNASLSIAVTGNAMPLKDHANMLGEVYFAIAGYTSENEIVYITQVANICKIYNIMKCDIWVNTMQCTKDYPTRDTTANISKAVRYFTAVHAYKLCKIFLENNELVAPEFKKISKKTAISYKHLNDDNNPEARLLYKCK